MNGDEVAETLAANVVLSGPEAETWRKVAHGQLEPDDVVNQRLVDEPVDSSVREQLDRAQEVFAPLADEQAHAQLEALLCRMDDASDDDAVVVAMPSKPSGSRSWIIGLVVVAVAAAVVLFVGLPPTSSEGPITFSAGYELEFDKLPETVRGTSPRPAKNPTLSADGPLSVRLRPERAVDSSVGVVVFVRDSSRVVRMLEIDPRIEDLGGIEIDTTVRAVGLTEGRYELVFAIGPPAVLPSSWNERIDDGDTSSYEIIRTPLEIVGDP